MKNNELKELEKLRKQVKDLEGENADLKVANEELLSTNEELLTINENIESSYKCQIESYQVVSIELDLLKEIFSSFPVSSIYREIDHSKNAKKKLSRFFPEMTNVLEEESSIESGLIPNEQKQSELYLPLFSDLEIDVKKLLMNKLGYPAFITNSSGELMYLNDLMGNLSNQHGKPSLKRMLSGCFLYPKATLAIFNKIQEEKLQVDFKIETKEKVVYHVKNTFLGKNSKRQIVLWELFEENKRINRFKKNKLYGDLEPSIPQLIEKNKQLMVNESLLRSIFHNSGIALGILDSQSRFIKVNAGFCNLTNFGEEEFLKNDLSLILSDKNWRFVKELVDSLDVGENEDEKFTLEFSTKGGSQLWGAFSIAILGGVDSENKYILLSISDITDIKLYQKALIEEKDKADEANKLKSTFLANMSHEIRTPMNGILGFTALLKNNKLGAGDRNRYVDIINERGGYLLKLINDIIDITKIEANQIEIYPSTFPLKMLFDEIRESFQCDIELNPDIDFFIPDLSLEKDVTLFLDHIRVLQILTNLVNNAIKFTPEGKISIEYERIEDRIIIKVTDTGIGIPKNKQSQVFSRFKQVRNRSRESDKGAGLGLAISRELAKLMKGGLQVDSELGKGTTFTLDLPIKLKGTEKRFNSEIKKVHTASVKTPQTILIVEDDDTSYMFLYEMLRRRGVKILRAKTGLEAVDLVKKMKTINLILMDILLPEMDGYEATKKIKQVSPDIPIIAQTANAMTGDKEKSLMAGCNDHLSKPLKKEVLLGVLSKYLQNSMN